MERPWAFSLGSSGESRKQSYVDTKGQPLLPCGNCWGTTVISSSPNCSGTGVSDKDPDEWVWELNPKKDPRKRWTMTQLSRQCRRRLQEREGSAAHFTI